MASIKRVGKDQFDIPIWEAVYRRTPGGKQVRKRFHLPTKAMVEREIQIDSQRSDIGLKWSEGTRLYLDAKLAEHRTPAAMEHVERAAKVFISIMGDLAIEETTPELMKEFMQAASRQPVKHRYSGKEFRVSGLKVANHHRKELLTVARYLRSHTGKISIIPFEHVPPFPVKAGRRSPLPKDRVGDYLNALPPHVLRPVQMVLYYGLRSTAVCNLTMESIGDGTLAAVDKGNVERRIPIDDLLAGIIRDAQEFRRGFEKDRERKEGVPAASLFLNANGRGWTRMTLLHAAQRAWTAAGLEKKKIHEVRHTLGTMAGKNFSPGMVQAAMGHRSRKSAEAYFHPNEEMAAEVRRKIITEISQNIAEHHENGDKIAEIVYTENGEYSCPHCRRKLLIFKEKGRKS
jgi:integrase